MPAEREPDELDRWLDRQVQPLAPPPGTFELITRRARRAKRRKAALSLASAAVVAAAIGVAVPLSSSLRLSATPTKASLAAGSSATARSGTGQANGVRGLNASGSPASSPAAPAASASASASSSGYLPPDYIPQSVTWDSTSTGWVLGPAGTAGHCANANPDICTSIARTDDGAQTWQGVPAPPTSLVYGLRFLNASDGWAFGQQLWATTDGGRHWHQVNTGGLCPTQLEAVNGRAYALFGTCTNTGSGRYQLMTAPAGSDNWTQVAGVPATQVKASGPMNVPTLQLAGPTGYLVMPDSTLFSGPVDGTAWHRVAGLPCGPGGLQPNGVGPLTAYGAPGTQHLAVICTTPSAKTTTIYRSSDGGTSWTWTVTPLPTATAEPMSVTSLPDGTLILAAYGAGQGGGGLFRLLPGATKWQAAQLSDPSGAGPGFAYVGMTSPTQGVALGGNPDLHAIWMTTDGGKTWTLRPIKA